MTNTEFQEYKTHLARQISISIDKIENELKYLKNLENSLRVQQLSFYEKYDYLTIWEKPNKQIYSKITHDKAHYEKLDYYEGLYNGYHHKMIEEKIISEFYFQ